MAEVAKKSSTRTADKACKDFGTARPLQPPLITQFPELGFPFYTFLHQFSSRKLVQYMKVISCSDQFPPKKMEKEELMWIHDAYASAGSHRNSCSKLFKTKRLKIRLKLISFMKAYELSKRKGIGEAFVVAVEVPYALVSLQASFCKLGARPIFLPHTTSNA